MTRLYGIKACDACRKALKSLQNQGVNASFHDVRDDPLPRTELDRFLCAFGEKLVNTRSTTWRGLSDADRQLPPLDLLAAHPTLMKRPVVETGAVLTLGWSKDIEAQHLGSS